MFLTNLFDNLGFTRDDAKWIIGLIAAIVVGLATLSDSAAAAFAIPAGALPYIRLGAFIVGIVSANYKTSGLPGRVWLLPLLLVVGLSVSSCASAHRAAIVLDQSFATAVFALDDAELQAYQTHVITEAQHQTLNPPIVKALQDVKSVSLAIKAAPTGVPTSLPSLLADLNDVQAAINAAAPVLPSIAAQASDANGKAIALLQSILGGK